MVRERRKSRVLEYFEQQKADAVENSPEESQAGGGGENPFREFDSAFGLDFADSGGSE